MSKVFISSTGRDLQHYRQAAIEICNKIGLTPIAMEFFESMGDGATEGSKRKLDEADLYIGIFAHRYGYIESGYEKAVTEIEFDYAGERKLDRLCFLADPAFPWPPEAIDYKNYSFLEDFKSRLNQAVIRSQFTTTDDFKAKLIHTLVEWQKKSAVKESTNLPVAGESSETFARFAAMPPLPALVVGREKDLGNLKTLIGIGNDRLNKQTIIVRGWPGVGKTTLVSALANDLEIAAYFSDGVFWVSLGENPESLQAISTLAQSLCIPVSEQAHTLDELREQVRAILQKKRVMLVVDDVWDAQAAAPFKVAGPRSLIVFTTRFRDVARQIAMLPEEVYLLNQLDEDEAVELLTQLAPSIATEHRLAVRQLVRDLEGLPLALRVAGRLFQAEAELGWSIEDLLAELSSGTRLLHEAAPDDRFDPETQTIPTVSVLLQKSTDRLDKETRDRFAYLGAFAPKPATFDLEAMQAVWLVDDPKPIARKLSDRGLLEPIIGLGRFQMHSILVMHAQELLERSSADSSETAPQ